MNKKPLKNVISSRNCSGKHVFQRFYKRILGIDYGRKRIGLATGDTELRIALPFRSIAVLSYKKAIRQIVEICKEEKIDEIVLGLPIPLCHSGQHTEVTADDRSATEQSEPCQIKNLHASNTEFSENDQIKEIKRFSEDLKKETNISVTFLDERFTTFQAENMMRGIQSRKKRKSHADEIAAQILLQEYLSGLPSKNKPQAIASDSGSTIQ